MANEKFDAAVTELWQGDNDGGIVTKWFTVVEGVNPDGDRWLNFFWSDGLKTWDVKGMLHSALDSQVANEVAENVTEED